MSQAETIPAPAETATEAPPSSDAALSFSPDVLAGMSEDIRATMPSQPTAEATANEEPPDSEDEFDDGLAEDDAGEVAQDAPPDAELDAMVDQVWKNPNMVARIPKDRLPEVVMRVLERRDDLATNAIQNTHKTAFEMGYQRARTEQQVAHIDQLQSDGDYDAVREALSKFPGGERNYYLLKAELQPVQDNSPQRYVRLGVDEAARAIQETPAIERELRANFDANKYAANEDGYRQLLKDIGSLQARHAAGQTPKTDPAEQALQRRQQAAATRRAAPRPEVSEGMGAPAHLKVDDIRRMTTEQVAAALRDPAKKKEIEAALASSR